MSAVQPTANRSSFVGQSVRRSEDRRLLRGGGRFVADVAEPGLLHAAFARSDLARARVRSVDVSAAEALPGVVAVYVGGRFVGTDAAAYLTVYGPNAGHPFRPLAGDEVRFVGDPIALVVAESRYIAEDACDLIDIDYEPMTPVLDPGDTVRVETDDLVHGDRDSNVLRTAPMSGPAPDLDATFADAAVVFETTIDQHRCCVAPMECRGITATWDPAAEELDVVMSGQSVHEIRLFLARYLGISETQISAHVGDVGGAFGQKKLWREEVCVVLAAHELGRTVQWVEDRRENLVAATHSRKERANVRMAVDADGVVQAMTVEDILDAGAYPVTPAGMYPTHVTGPYRIPLGALSFESHFTNTMGRGSFRAPGMFETTAREMSMDLLARRLGLDPVELRRRNLLHASDLPYVNAFGKRLEEMTPAEAFEGALDAIGYESFRAEQAAARAQGRYLGLGVSVHVAEFAGPGPTYSTDAATVRIEPGGDAMVFVGLTDQGMSLRTTMAQVAADQLGLHVDQVKVVQADTRSTPFGAGAGGSKSAVLAGGAVHKAATTVRDKMFAIAAHRLEVAPEDLEVADGRVTVRGTPAVGMDVTELARIAYVEPAGLPTDIGAGLEATERYRPARYPTWTNAAHACTVEIDLATCIPRILRYVVVEDCGRMINPQIVEGQIRGSVVQGVGSVFYERFVYDDDGNPLTSTFVDYLLPTAAESPTIELSHLETPSTTNPGGFKGVAESGNISSPAALANAVADALAPLGVSVSSTQLGPNDIFDLLRSANASAL